VLSELEVLRDVCARLDHAGIAYMLTGSRAMSFYARPRMTRDIDIVVAVEPPDADALVALFQPDYYVPDEAARRAVHERGMFNLLHLDSAVKIDLVVRKDETYRREEFARRTRIDLPGFAVSIVTKEDLILSKLAWAKDSRSELQLRDVGNLLAAGADTEYLRKWAVELGVVDLLEECLRERYEP